MAVEYPGGCAMRIGVMVVGCALLSAGVAANAERPKAAHAELKNAQGATVGTAKFKATANGVKVSVKVSQLAPGEHGIHIHTVGKCEAPAFSTAGGHFNPTGAHHGAKNAQEPHPHVGDLDNLSVGQNGKASTSFTITGATLADGQNSLFHEGGTALVIHGKADDLMSDPSGNSGERVACGVIEK
jgi:superoxide dismutase, Cu-Zn family